MAGATLHEADGRGSIDGKALAELNTLKKKTKQGVLKAYMQVVHNVQKTYSTEDVISEEDNDIFGFTQPTNTTPLQFDDALWMENLQVSHV